LIIWFTKAKLVDAEPVVAFERGQAIRKSEKNSIGILSFGGNIQKQIFAQIMLAKSPDTPIY